MNKKILMFLLILISICAISHVSAADSSDFIAQDNSSNMETQIIDENLNEDVLKVSEIDEKVVADGGRDEADDYRNIQTLIDNAKEGGTIYLNGTYVCDYLINVNKSIHIVGDNPDGAIIKLSDEYQDYDTPFFNVIAPDVTMENLKFNGGLFIFGGALTWQGDNGRITNCQFNDNIARDTDNGIGGALWLSGNNCILENCIFNNNHAYKYGGAILWNGDDGIIRDCYFINNRASGNKGWGGALMLYADNCVINNCSFINNSCTDYGGAIATHNNTNKIVGCYFEENSILNNLSFNDNKNDLQGGAAIFSSCIGLTIDSCNFINNYARNALGGALSLANNNTVTRSYFKGNLALYGNDILATTSSKVSSNHFVLDFNETKEKAVYGIDENELETLFNTFELTKIDSVVTFTAGMVFTYAQSGKIGVVVDGGILELENIRVLDHPEAKINFTNDELNVSGLNVGEYTLIATTTPDEFHNAVDGVLKITVKKSTAVISAEKTTVALKKSTYWSIKLVDSQTKKPISGMKLTLKVYTGKKYKTAHVTTNSKGEAKYQTKSLAQGSHKIVVSAKDSGYTFNTLTSSINVIKPTPLTFKVIKATKKDGTTLSITVYKKSTKKPINGVQIKLLVYTGKKYNIIVLKTKTNSGYKGVCGYGTNTLSVGTHKVVIQPANIKYSGSVTSSMVIKSTAKKYPKWTHRI